MWRGWRGARGKAEGDGRALEAHAFHQAEVVENLDSDRLKKGLSGGLEKILVPGTNDVRLTEDCRLDDDDIIDVPNRRDQPWVWANDLAHLAQKPDVMKDTAFGQSVQGHHARVAQDFRELVENLVRGQQNIAGLDEGEEQFPGKSFRPVMCSNENRRIENDSH
jgi:hypothetical protein